jgi:hypothetical protein
VPIRPSERREEIVARAAPQRQVTPDEAAIQFLASDVAAAVAGCALVVDGDRVPWIGKIS